MAESTDFSLLNFPDKLWYMVNEPKCKQIEWNSDGTSIIIPNNHEFVSEVLNNPSKILFKTKNFSSFVRQLNLYGFRKVSEHRRVGQTQPVATNRSEFKHPSFLKDRKDLLEEVKRQPNSNKKEESPSEEKPRSGNNEVLMQHYGALNPNPSSLGGIWPNWDPFLCPFSWMPYGGATGGYTLSNQPQYQSQGYYGKDGLPYYVPYYSPMTNSAQYPYDEVYANGNRDGLVTNDNTVPKPTATLSSQSTPSSVMVNNSRDHVPTGNSFHGCTDVNKSLANGHRNPPSYFLQEAKKPIPAQTAEVSTTSNTSCTNIHDWKMSGQTAVGMNDKVIKTKEEKLRAFEQDQCSTIQDKKKLKFKK